ncbi:predicted protein [Botrytis cinerea T4]|uniref:Uncharacterized protein n=1 Tax=Botryotinia fuckeliana (strain T4) TaxID=999810 RepID=G2XPI6_BOTF4|nr:predicted protein [Botrytis cinerea T4]
MSRAFGASFPQTNHAFIIKSSIRDPYTVKIVTALIILSYINLWPSDIFTVVKMEDLKLSRNFRSAGKAFFVIGPSPWTIRVPLGS